jgi:uncharacterized protein (TIGR03435 family)
MNCGTFALAAGGLYLGVATVAAQAVPAFELVSVRRAAPVSVAVDSDPSNPRARLVVLAGGRLEARGQTLANLARVAFGFESVDPSRGMVDAGADWQWNDRFDITATADHEWTTPPSGTTVPSELRAMLRALLEERFALKARIETRNRHVTALRRIKQGSEPGPGLRPSTDACLGPYTDAPRGVTSPSRCPFTLTNDRLQAGAVTLAEAALLFARIQGLLRAFGTYLPIVDQTGLDGRYDLSLSIRPEVKEIASSARDVRRSIEVIRAIEAQLGLKFERARVQIPTLIIERARKPVED